MNFVTSSNAWLEFHTTAREVSPFPPPLCGRVSEGVTPREVCVRGTPTPNPSPKGGGERSVLL